MSAGDHKRHSREKRIVKVAASTQSVFLLEQHRMDVALHVVDSDQRLLQSSRESLAVNEPYQQRADQARTRSDRDAFNVGESDAGAPACFLDHRSDSPQMLAGSEFRNNASVLLVSRYLGCHDVGQYSLAVFNHGRRGFIATGLNSQNQHLTFSLIRMLAYAT